MANDPEPIEVQVTIQIDPSGHWRNEQNEEDRFNLYINGDDFYLNAEEVREFRDLLAAALVAHERATQTLADAQIREPRLAREAG